MENLENWIPKNIYQVINIDAEAMPDEVFNAVHTSYDIELESFDPNGETSTKLAISPEGFLDQFLLSQRSHTQGIIIGESGSGKSHFIQWMRLNIPKQENTILISIPKAGTSLKNIVKRVIQELPSENQKKYIEQLEKSNQYIVSERGRKDRLLDQIAFAVRELTPLDPNDEMEVELIKETPHLFRDTFIRESFYLSNEGIISELNDHIFSTKENYKPAEEERRFNISDLPLEVSYGNCAITTRNVLDMLRGDYPCINKALEIINRALPEAIVLSLSFSSDSLIDLMNELREVLHLEGKKLILLIEDLTRLQGLDKAMLQALITPSNQGERTLCELRWMAAVTTGYYGRIEDTVKTRMNFIVYMDLSGKKTVGREGLIKFTARYLNAARLGLENLKTEYEKKQLGGPYKIKIAGVDSDNYEKLSSAFGQYEGICLFPFTEQAIWNMAKRVDSNFEEKFNPRRFLSKVITNILDKYLPLLNENKFPPRALLDELGNIKAMTDVSMQKLLQEKDPNDWNRRITMLELWDGTGKKTNLSPEIEEYFNFKQINFKKSNLGETRRDYEIDNNSKISPEVGDDFPHEDKLSKLRKWKEGETLSQNLAQELRELLYSAIDNSISWDTEGLERTTFSSKSDVNKPFRNLSFKFIRQETISTVNPPVKIEIAPHNEMEFTNIVFALEGLLKFQYYKNWNFEKGYEYLIQWLEFQNKLTKEVTEKLHGLYSPSEKWDYNQAISELLITGCLLSGKISKESFEFEELLDACFRTWAPIDEENFFTQEIISIAKYLANEQEHLIKAYKAINSGTKGGQVGAFINPLNLEKAYKYLKKNDWCITLELPNEISTFPALEKISDIYRVLLEGRNIRGKEKLDNLFIVLEREFNSRQEWVIKLNDYVDVNLNGKELSNSIQENLLNSTEMNLSRRNADKMNEELIKFKGTQFDNYIRLNKKIFELGLVKSLPLYVCGNHAIVKNTNDLLFRYEEYIKEVEETLKNNKENFENRGGNILLSYQNQISESLTELENLLKVIGG